MNDKERDSLLESQKEEISRLKRELNAERRESSRARAEASQTIHRIEEHYETQIAGMEQKRIDTLHSKGTISYFDDRRCATCEFFDSSRECILEDTEKPIVQCTNGFCTIKDSKIGEVSPSAGCSKWKRWSEIDASLEVIAQKEREEKDRWERLQALTRANEKHKQTIAKNNRFISIPVSILILSLLVLGLIGWYRYEFRLTYYEELKDLSIEHEWNDASRWISRYEEEKQSFNGFLIFCGIYGAVFAAVFSFCIYTRNKRLKQIKESQPNPSDFGFEKKEE